MLRSDAELALDEAVLAVSEAARLHREAAHNRAATIRPGLAEAADLRERIAEELAEAARKAGARRVREIRVVPARALQRLRDAITMVTPRYM